MGGGLAESSPAGKKPRWGIRHRARAQLTKIKSGGLMTATKDFLDDSAAVIIDKRLVFVFLLLKI